MKSEVEIEQWFIPRQKFAEYIQHTAITHLEIIQGYLPKGSSVTKKILFEPESGEVERAAVIFSKEGVANFRFTTENSETIERLQNILASTNGECLEKARVRYIKNSKTGREKFVLTLKGEKISGVAPECEFEIPKREALRLMIALCAEKLVHKTRHIKVGDVADIERVFELDEFHGRHHGKLKLEIEHSDKSAQWLKPKHWREFASEEITNDKSWGNRQMAGSEPFALAALVQLLRGKGR